MASIDILCTLGLLTSQSTICTQHTKALYYGSPYFPNIPIQKQYRNQNIIKIICPQMINLNYERDGVV